jgi:lipopolysaccharide export system protein LptA
VGFEGDAVLEDDRTVMRSSELEYNTATKRLVAQGSGGVEIVTNPNRD